jgi:hypothetical protein
MNTETQSKEQRILRALRKTLCNVVKDVTPRNGSTNPLTDNTIQDIKDCFGMIAERESELAKQLNFDQARPYYKDGDQPAAQVISFVKPNA